MTTTINVGIMGFCAHDENKFKKIFALSQHFERAYKLNQLADMQPVAILIVKSGDDLVLRQQQIYQARYKNNRIPVVMAGREPATHQEFYLRGVLLPSRVFSVLDSIEISASEQHLIVESAKISDTLVTDALQVLVVEDSVMMQKTVELELKKASIPLAVDFADSGEIALEKIKLKKYDFIFLDVMMSGIDGFETCSQIRKLKGMAKTPVIMLTAKASAPDEVKGLMAGCTTYLTKPFEHDEFHKMLERIVRWVKEFNDRK